ncbi:ribosomal protein S18-alanine N-acetyltransferase [Heyndrickxia vini]
MNYQLREANIADLDGIMDVEVQSFSLPWSREAFYNEFVKNHFARYFVIVDQEKIIGYCGVWLVVDEAHITNIAILPEYRGQKLGELLLSSIMDYSIQQGAKSMTLEVRVSNVIAQSLYKKLGFFEGGIRKSYYTDNQEDALVMWVNL